MISKNEMDSRDYNNPYKSPNPDVSMESNGSLLSMIASAVPGYGLKTYFEYKKVSEFTSFQKISALSTCIFWDSMLTVGYTSMGCNVYTFMNKILLD